MRHGKKINHLGRTDTHRKAMLANMASSLIMHKRINTTVAKAKALRVYVEPLLTKAKNDTTHSRRMVFNYLQSKESVTELFREVAVKIADRPGGYTRIIKTGARLGDNAEMCFIELVDYNDLYGQGKGEEKKEKTTRRGRSRGKKSAAAKTGAEGTAAAATEDAANDKGTASAGAASDKTAGAAASGAAAAEDAAANEAVDAADTNAPENTAAEAKTNAPAEEKTEAPAEAKTDASAEAETKSATPEANASETGPASADEAPASDETSSDQKKKD